MLSGMDKTDADRYEFRIKKLTQDLHAAIDDRERWMAKAEALQDLQADLDAVVVLLYDAKQELEILKGLCALVLGPEVVVKALSQKGVH